MEWKTMEEVAKEKKYFLEIRGRGRMALREVDFNPYHEFINGESNLARKTAVMLFPEGNPVTNPLHNILSNSKTTWDNITYTGKKDVPSAYLIPEILIVVEKNVDGKITTYISFQLFQVRVYDLFQFGPGYKHYLLGFANYLQPNKHKGLVKA